MTRKWIVVVGLVMLGLLAGHLALNAAGSGKVVLDKMAKSASAITTPRSDARDQTQIAADAAAKLAAERPDRSSIERKAKQAAAIAAGHDATIVCNLSDRDLDKLVAGLRHVVKTEPQPEIMHNASVSSVSPETPVDPEKALAEALAAKAAIEAASVTSPAPMNSIEPVKPAVVPNLTQPTSLDDAMRRQQNSESLPAEEKEMLSIYAESQMDRSSHGNDGSLDNVGGPDLGRYFWMDNQGTDTTSYNWIELRGDPQATFFLGSSFGSLDGAVKRIPLGFTFPFYSGNYDSVSIGIDGYILFAGTTVSFSNVALPTTVFSGGIVCAYWDDGHLARGGITTGNNVMGYRNFGTYTVIEIDSMGLYDCNGTSRLTYQYILYNNGKIKVQYNTMNYGTCVNSGTVGIQAPSTTGPALQVCYNSATNAPAAGRAIWYYNIPYTHDFSTTSLLLPVAGTVFGPSVSVPVSARIRNFGQTIEAGTISYIFNGGTVVTEATSILATGASEVHAFATPLTTPAATGTYPLKIWTTVPFDSGHSNDTISTTVNVFVGSDCSSAILLTGTGGPTVYNTCGAGDNSPGQPCGPLPNSSQDMVFKMDVPNGSQASIWQSANAIDSRHTLRWGGACPGTNIVSCIDDPDTAKYVWANTTGATQTLYFTVGAYNGTTSPQCGNVTLRWEQVTCTPIAVPPMWTEAFDASLNLPACWTTQDVVGDGTNWGVYATNPRSTPYDMSIASVATINDDWLFSPPLALTAGAELVLEYYRRVSSASYPDSLEVKYGTAPTAAAMTSTLIAVDSCKSTTYLQKSGSFTPASTGTYYIGFHSVSRNSTARTNIDDIRLYPSGTCTAPDSVRVSATRGQDQVTLSSAVYGGSGGPAQYQWYHGVGVTNVDSLITGATSASYTTTVSGSFSCKAWRANAATCSAWDSAYATVIICSAPVTPPLFEGFELTTGTSLPDCWSVQNYDGDARNWEAYGTDVRTGLRNAHCQYSVDGTIPNDWLYTRKLALTTGTTYVLDFWWRQQAASTLWHDSLQVLLTTVTDNVSTVSTIVPQFHINNVGTYQNSTSIFTAPSTGNYYVAFFYRCGDNEGGVLLDDISIYPQGFCVAPDSIRVPAATGENSVTLTASIYGGSGGPAEYQWYRGVGISHPDSLIVGATEATYAATVSGAYTCKGYRANATTCAVWDSAYARVIDCTLPVTLPLLEGFEGTTGTAVPTCWTVLDANSDTRTWVSSTTDPRTGLRSAYCTYSSSGTFPVNDWIFLPPAALTAGSPYILDFWYRGNLEDYTEKLEVKYGTAPNAAAMTGMIADTFAFIDMVTYTLTSLQFSPASSNNYYVGIHAVSGTDQGGILVDDIAFYPFGACVAPDSVRVPAVSGIGAVTMTASVYGGMGGPAQYQWYQGVDCATGTLIPGATSNSYTTTATGSYACKAWRANSSTCAVCDSAYATVQTDPCTPVAIPTFENFNGVTTPALPNCWKVLDSDGTSPVWVTSSNNYYSSPNAAYIGWRDPTLNDWLLSPPLSLIGGHSYMLDYQYRAGSSSLREDLEVKMGTIPHGNYLTTTLVSLDTFRVATFRQKSATFTPATTGNYYIGWHATSADGSGIYVDDIRVYERGTCGAPDSVRASAAVGVGSVNLTAISYGGFGGDPHYQWFRGADCLYANRIEGARSATITTDTSGVFSCRVWRGDSLTCGTCDSALATVTPPPPGEVCATAIVLTVPVPGTPTVVSGTTAGMYPNCTDVCGTSSSSGPDMFYSLTLTACHRIAMKLTGGDTHLTLYQGLAHCCSDPLLCNEDDALFTPLPAWDVAEQHPGGTNAYIAADLNAGTYLIRVAYAGTTSGAFGLTLYDNGPCVAPCNPAANVTVYISPTVPGSVWLNFMAPDTGSYVIYSTINKNNDGDPRGGDPMWITETTLHVTAAGPTNWTCPGSAVAYKNFAIVKDCGSPIGRCCYGDPGNPSCADNTDAQCQALTGSWNQYRSCAAHPCPVVQPAAADSCNGVGELRGALPISVSSSTLGKIDNFSVRDLSATPACWSGDYFTAATTAAGPDVCYGWTVPATGTYTISTCGANTNYDTCLLLYSFTCPTPPVNATDLICGSDDVCTSNRAEIQSVALTAGQHVLIVVDTYNYEGGGVGGAYDLTIAQP